MSTGEYISVTNQNELVHAEVALERRIHARFPAAEEAELAEYFGPSRRTRTRLARRRRARSAVTVRWSHVRRRAWPRLA